MPASQEAPRLPSWLEWTPGGRFFLYLSSHAASDRLKRLILIGIFPWEEITRLAFSFPVQDIQSKREVEWNTEEKVTEGRVLTSPSTIQFGGLRQGAPFSPL